MTDEKINMEAAQGGESVAETPTQQGSTPAAQPSPVDEESLKALVEPWIKSEVEKRVDSYKDKRIAKLSTETKTLKESLAEVKALQAEGMSEKQAVQYIETQSFLDTQGKEVPTDAPPADELAAQTTVAVDEGLSAILKFTGLDSGEADVVAIIKANPNNELAQISAVTKLAESRKEAQTTPGSAAAVLPSGVGASVGSEDIGSLSERLTELVDLPVQTPESEAERAEIRAKINKLEPIQKTIVGV